MSLRQAIAPYVEFGTGRNTGMARIDCEDLPFDEATEEGRDDLGEMAVAIHRAFPAIVHVLITRGDTIVGEVLFPPDTDRMS